MYYILETQPVCRYYRMIRSDTIVTCLFLDLLCWHCIGHHFWLNFEVQSQLVPRDRFLAFSVDPQRGEYRQKPVPGRAGYQNFDLDEVISYY